MKDHKSLGANLPAAVSLGTALLSLNPTKSNYLVITPKLKEKPQISLKLNSHHLSFCEDV